MAERYGDTSRLQRLANREVDWCLRFNRATDKRAVECLFSVASRLGDGVFWYALMACLLLAEGVAAVPAVGRMAVAGGIGLVLYKWLKAKTVRPRPCDSHARIRAAVPPLDQHSFPSGHTLHAVSFSLIASYYYPRLAWLVLPFTALVALSRLVLGLHYPSDVLAGALLGVGLAMLALQF